jgi:ribonucleoside-diphosphate reductase alpha chain
VSTHAPFASPFPHGIYKARYAHPGEEWGQTAVRVTRPVMSALNTNATPKALGGVIDATHRIADLISKRRFIPGGRYLYATGRPLHQVQNCLLLRCDDSREGWAEHSYKAEMSLMTGAGIGTWYGDVRGEGSVIEKTGGLASGPLSKMNMTNEIGRNVMQGGARRSAIWAGLPWWHPDIFKFIRCKDWSEDVRAMKAKDWNFPAPMDMTNISVTLDDAFFECYADFCAWPVGKGWTAPDGGSWQEWAREVYRLTMDKMLTTGEPGFTIDCGEHSDEVLRNACTEITSADDSDVCNLGSIVISRFDTPEQFGSAVRDAVLFLTAGTLYSDLPYDKVYEVREKNRRLGLGIMGGHEFMLKHGCRYGSDDAFEALEPYMREYARALEYAWDWQDRLGISRSIGATAIAPNGTIGIIAETTPSGEPIFSAAEKRVIKHASASGDTFTSHIVVDPVAKRLVEEGVDPSLIDDAYSLSYDPERRLKMQQFYQSYTDHAISSTVNLPSPVRDPREQAEFGELLMKYLPTLRGITCYPDGARAGQPKTPVPLEWALERDGEIIVETDEESCANGVCGL